jgi:hypothetical protein
MTVCPASVAAEQAELSRLTRHDAMRRAERRARFDQTCKGMFGATALRHDRERREVYRGGRGRSRLRILCG